MDGIFIFAAICVGRAAGIGYLGVAVIMGAFFCFGNLILWGMDYGQNPLDEAKQKKSAPSWRCMSLPPANVCSNERSMPVNQQESGYMRSAVRAMAYLLSATCAWQCFVAPAFAQDAEPAAAPAQKNPVSFPREVSGESGTVVISRRR